MQRPSVVVGWCSRLDTKARFVNCLDDLRDYDRSHEGYITGKVSLYSGPRIAEARSQIVDHFASKTDADWLFMVDDDMTFRPDALARLMRSADPRTCPVLGALCFAGVHGGRVYPTLYRAYNDENDGHFGVEPLDAWPLPDGLVKVGATGAAAMLVHRSVFARLRLPGPVGDESFDPKAHGFGTLRDGRQNPYPWFEEGLVAGNGAPLGEDVAMCRKMLLLGIPIHVDASVRFGHCKEVVLTAATYDDYRRERDRPSLLLDRALQAVRESGRLNTEQLERVADYLRPRHSLLSDLPERPAPQPFVLPEQELVG